MVRLGRRRSHHAVGRTFVRPEHERTNSRKLPKQGRDATGMEDKGGGSPRPPSSFEPRVGTKPVKPGAAPPWGLRHPMRKSGCTA
jgi:hypothetical protein